MYSLRSRNSLQFITNEVLITSDRTHYNGIVYHSWNSMYIHIVSIFPDIFKSFLETSLIKKAQEKGILTFSLINPRNFCPDKHQTVDDTICGWGAGLLMKAKPAIDAVESIIKNIKHKKFKIVLPSPSKEEFNQKMAHSLSEEKNIIFICTRYEGIDYRFEQYMNKKYPKHFQKISLWHFITLGGETPAMVMIEAISRLIPWVIKEEVSRQDESYSVKHNMNNLEYPQYTKPEEVYGMKVPKVLLSGHHGEIQKRRETKTKFLAKKTAPWKKKSKKS
jgi:tRNA (guanine37-N1)-methyltransferase